MWWAEALWRWAWSDRIRTSPRDGKLLRLPVGACVRVRDTVARVTGRTLYEGSGAGGSGTCELDYTCRTAADEFRLCVRPASAGSGVRVWVRRDGRAHEVAVHDVEAFG